jgi:hypothetical protein
MSDEITVSSTEALYDDYANLKSQTPSEYAPFGLAGIIVNDCDIICGNCATDEELADNDNGAIFGDAEWDYPAPVCEDCEKPLNVNLIVNKSYDPELHLRLCMTEELGGFADTDCLTIGEIGEKAAERAAEIGWDYDPTDMFESDEHYEILTDSAQYISNIAPQLRQLAGYEDGAGKGTYNTTPTDIGCEIHKEDLLPAFREAYHSEAVKETYNTTPTDIGCEIHKEDLLPEFREAYYSEAVKGE